MQAVDYALARDSSSSDGWMALGYLLGFRHPRTLDGVLEAMRRSTMLDPRNAEAWHQYGSWLSSVGRFDETIDAMGRALLIEPSRPVSYLQRAQVHEIEHRDRQAAIDYDSAIAADPEFYAAYFQRTWVRLRAGDITGARADAEAALRWSPPSELYYGLAPLAAVAARTGDTAAARQFMARAVAPYALRHAGPLVIQVFVFGFVATGQISEALDWLERAEPKGALLWWNLLYPALDALRGNPRFERVLAASRPPGAR
jgi:tetratricopeptide (TPR) repeat protein